MIDTRTFNYSFTLRDSEGVLRASSDLFYGPWDSREEALSSIKNALGVTDASVLPDGAKVAIWDNAQHTSLVEYILSHGILINNKSVGITSYTKTVYAYYLGETDNAPMFGSGSISKMKNDLSQGHWYLSIPEEYDPETNILTVSFATFLVSQDTYTRINDDHTTYEGDPSWGNLFRIGGGVGSSTLVSDKVFRFDITNDNAIIPTNGGMVTKEALKLASKSILTVYLNGKKQNSEDITQLALLTMDEFPFEVKYEVSDDGNHFLYYWLEPLNGADSVTLLPGSMYMLPITISIAGDTASGILILRIHISQGTSKYNLICSPNIINVTKTYEFPSLSFIALKITWDGFLTTESLQEDFSIELSLVGEDQDENYIFTSNNSTLVIDDTQYRSLLINKTSHDTLKVVLKVDNNIEDTEYLPIFFQSNLVGSANRDLTIDILNENCQVSESLVGKEDIESRNALKTLTKGSLIIMYQGLMLNSNYYQLDDVSDTVLLSDRNIYETEGDNGFYMTKLVHSSTTSITFTYVNPSLGKTLALASREEKNQLTYFQSVNIVKDGADAEFYRFNTFPAVIWVDDNGFVPDTLEVYAYKVKGSTVTRLGGNDNVSLNGYKYRIEYGLQDSPADPIPFSNNNNQIPLDASNKNVDHIEIYYYDSQNNELDREYFDINRYPKDGDDGTSPYIIYTDNPVVVIDDDSSKTTIENRSHNSFTLYHGGVPSQETVLYKLKTDECELFDETGLMVDGGFGTIFKEGDGTNLKLVDNLTDLNGHYYTGKAVWAAYIGEMIDENIVARLSQTIKVYDISNGETYFLNISPNMLYFDLNGSLRTDLPTTLRFSASKILDGNVESISFNQTTYINIKDSTPNNEAVTITDDGESYKDIDFALKDYVFPVTVSLYVNGHHLLDQSINLAIQGNAATTIDSGYIISIDNDLVRIDDQTNDTDLASVSETNIQVLHEGVVVDLEDIDPDYTIDISIDDRLKQYMSLTQTVNNQYQYHLNWTQSQINKSIHDKVSGKAVITFQFNDGLNQIKIQKTQTIQVLDFSQGEVYKLSVTPNCVRKTIEDNLIPERVECSVTKTYKGDTSECNIAEDGREVDIEVYLYKYTQQDNITKAIKLDTEFITSSSDKTWFGESGNNIALFLDVMKGTDRNISNITPDFIEVRVIKNNKCVDSETIQYIKEAQDGVDGNSIEYVYLRKEQLDNNLLIDNINDYGYYYQDDNPILIHLSDAHTISDVIPVISYTSEYESFIGWSDEPQGVSEEYPYEYMSKRTYNGKTKRWSNFSQPILWAKYGLNGQKGDKGDDAVSPYMLSINNDTVIIDDNANDNTIKTASLTTVKLYQGVNEIIDAVIEASENNQKFNCIQENGKWYLVKQQTGNIDLGTYPIEYIAKIGNIPVASAILSVKVVDVTEDGCSFKLELSNDVLYRENIDTGGVEGENVTIKLQKIIGEASASNYLELTNGSLYKIYVNNDYKEAAISAKETVEIDTHSYKKSEGNIIVEAYKKIDELNSILLDRETISFAVRGEQGPQGESIQGPQGNPGLNGCTIRHHYQSENHPQVGYVYRNDSELNTTDIKYIDIIIFDKEPVQDDGQAATRYPVLICLKTHIYGSQNDDTTTPKTYHSIWGKIDDYTESNHTYSPESWSTADVNEGYAFFNYVSALNARIENLVAQHASVEELTILEDASDPTSVKGKFTTDLNLNDQKPLWLGGSTAQTAKFWVDKNGNASFGGSLTTSGDINLGGDLTVDGNGTFSGELTFSNAKSRFEGTSIAKEVYVKLSELTPIENTANYYINPLDYGVNVVILNDIYPSEDEHVSYPTINIYIDMPAYELSSISEKIPDNDNNKQDKYKRYCNTFVGLKLRIVCKETMSIPTEKEGETLISLANVYYRGLLSYFAEANISDTTSSQDLLNLLTYSSTSPGNNDNSFNTDSINLFNYVREITPSEVSYNWRVPTYLIGATSGGNDQASYPIFRTVTVNGANVEFILGCHKYNIEGKEYVVWLSEMHQQLGDYMNYEIENTIDKERLITRDISS